MDISLEPKSKLRRFAPYIAAIALFIGACIWLAFSDIGKTLSVERRNLNIGEVQMGRFDDFVRLDGQVQPFSTIQICPQEGGIVMERVVEEGAHVKKGDVLVRLSNANLDLEILNAEANLAEKQNFLRNTQITMEQDRLNNRQELLQLNLDVSRKQRNYQQQERLFKEQLNTREEYLQAKEEYELAKKKQRLILQRLDQDSIYRSSQVEQLRENLDNMRQNLVLIRERKAKLEVRSPADGEIGLLDVELGQSVGAGGKIGQLNDLSDYKVIANVDEHYIDRVRAGLIANYERNEHRYHLRVRKVFPEVRNGSFRVEFVFDGERPDRIRNGQTYYLDLQLGESKQAVLIPKGTFFSVTGGSWVFVLDADGHHAYRRNICIGRQNPKFYEVLEGLEPGEQVITSGYEAFKNRETLTIK
ncbi:MAG: efflux RND transporter periplasmic adaptor subunit [Bacteroidaceae bacterium]|nr:efflux RND transporter periplasmic adaptor subunit [Bacteroidaceae bacterium]